MGTIIFGLGILKKTLVDRMTLLMMMMKTFHLTGEADHIVGNSRFKVRLETDKRKAGKKSTKFGISLNMIERRG